MKQRIFLLMALVAFLVLPGWTQVNSLDQFFNRYQDDPEFTLVNVSPKLFQMFSKLDLDEETEEVKEVIRGINSLRILIRDSVDGRQLYQEAFSQITKSDYEELLTVRDGGENIRFLVKESDNNIINQLVLLVGGTDEFVLLDIQGNINLQSIGKLGESLDVPGAEHLNKVQEKH